MKRIFMALALCVAVSCTNKSEVAQNGAQSFLDAFLANDFNTAAACCTEGFQEEFNAATESYRNLDGPIKALLQEECSRYKAEITSVRRVNESDTFLVNYNIVHIAADSLQMKKGAINSTLVVVEGKVDKINR